MHGPLTPLFAYLLGSIPFGYLIVRWQKGVDVRSTGSGSTGATNVMRNLGIIGFVATFILDVGKGTFAVLLASRLTSGDPRWIAACVGRGDSGPLLPRLAEIPRRQRRRHRRGSLHCPRSPAGCAGVGHLRHRRGDLALYFPGFDRRHGGVSAARAIL